MTDLTLRALYKCLQTALEKKMLYFTYEMKIVNCMANNGIDVFVDHFTYTHGKSHRTFEHNSNIEIDKSFYSIVRCVKNWQQLGLIAKKLSAWKRKLRW